MNNPYVSPAAGIGSTLPPAGCLPPHARRVRRILEEHRPRDVPTAERFRNGCTARGCDWTPNPTDQYHTDHLTSLIVATMVLAGRVAAAGRADVAWGVDGRGRMLRRRFGLWWWRGIVPVGPAWPVEIGVVYVEGRMRGGWA